MNFIVFALVSFGVVFCSEDIINSFFQLNVCPECDNSNIRNEVNKCKINICDCLNIQVATKVPLFKELVDENSANRRLPKMLPPKPSIYCVETNKIALIWTTNPQTFYFLEYSMNKNETNFTNITTCGHEIITNLLPGRLYAIVLHSYTIIEGGKLMLQKEVLNVKTRDLFAIPSPARNLTLLTYFSNNNELDILVQWNETYDAACYFEILVIRGEEYFINEITYPLSLHKVKLRGFSHGQVYSIGLTAFSEYEFDRWESKKSWLNGTTPLCYEVSETPNTCVPEQPHNVSVQEYAKEYNVVTKKYIYYISMNWSKPRITPEYYIAKLQNLDDVSTRVINISGNSTSFIAKNVGFGSGYQILLQAYSEGGASLPAVFHRHINDSVWYFDDGEAQLTLELVLLFISCPLIITGVVLIYISNKHFVKRNKEKNVHNYFTELEKTQINVSTSVVTVSERIDNTDKWEIDLRKLCIRGFIGKGEFGIVRKAQYLKDGEGESQEVAIKMLRDDATEEEKRQLFQEIEIMKSVPSHPQLIGFVGCITRENILLVTEFCSGGNLQNYLRIAWKKLTNGFTNQTEFANKLYDFSDDGLNKILEPKDLISFARQIAVGMEYLSSLRVIHRDLAARNILIFDKHTVKISDFGLSRDVYCNNVYRKVTFGKLPLRWMAVESITHQVYTTKSDVWSFGVLLWEIVTLGSTPYPGVSTQNLLVLLRQGYRLEKPSNCSEDLYNLMLKCWNTCPSQRPSFSDLRIFFENLVEEISDYLSLDFNQ